MWTCPKCGEKLEDQFDSCWKCAVQPEKTVSVHIHRRWRRFFLVGCLFEAVLIALCCFLPESWLQVEVQNFVTITHYPVMIVMMMLAEILSLFAIPIGFVIMASVWGFLIYLVTLLTKVMLARCSKRQKLVFKFSVSLFGAAILLCAFVFNLPATPIPFTASPEVKSAVDGNTAFALDLYQKLKQQPGNLFFSPFSISTSLAMTYAGARGQTETEMAKALHFNLGQTNLPAAFGELTTRMSRIQRWNRITLAMANSLWCQKDYQFTDTFLNLVHNSYRAEARQVDFRHSPQAAANEINGWVERQTKGKITGAVEPGQFTDLTRLVLCDAIYFKGKWQHQFKVGDTKPAPFHVATNETVTVPMMHQKEHFKMAQSDDYSVELLELPYSGTDLSMIILLPQIEYPSPDVENPGLPDLEQKLNTDNLRAWLAKLDQASPHETWVTLPRFTTAQSIDLVKTLQSLGMTSAFDDSANFFEMDGTTNLFISQVIHKAFVEVNESGTEAAAVSLELVKTKGMSGRFIVDHPFIFLIRENGSGSILFIGRIIDPTK
jgi:serine protease inhibitor